MAANNSSSGVLADLSNTTSAVSGGGYSEADLLKIGRYNAAITLVDLSMYVMWAVGIPSNIFSFLTSSQMRPVSSSTLFISILALVDLFFILWNGFFWIPIVALKAWMPFEACRLYFYMGSVMMHSSIWVLVAITTERFIAVWLPLKVSNICTTKRAAMASLIAFVCILAVNIPYSFIPHSYQAPSGQWFCRYDPSYKTFLSWWTFVEHSIYMLIPWPVLTVCDVLIICGLRLSAKRKQHLTNRNGGPKNPTLNITIMLVSASVISLILLTPNTVFFIHLRVTQWDYQSTADDYATYRFCSAFVYFLSNMNHVVNFWVYVISGKRFRQKFFDIITCRGKRGKKYASSATATSMVSVTKKVEERVSKIQVSRNEANGKDIVG